MTCISAKASGLPLLALAAALSWPSVPRAQAEEVAAAPAALSPREAGARYGQALGAIGICYGSKLTETAEALPKSFADSDAEIFKAQAAKILDAWTKVKNCVDQKDPNTCKIIMDKSCLAAEAEIGAKGSAMPGLVEFMKH